MTTDEQKTCPVTFEEPVVLEKNSGEYLMNRFTTVIGDIESQRKNLTLLEKELKTLKKGLASYMKNAEKKKKHKRPRDPNRPPSGFARPTDITDELARFLNKEPGTLMARTEVTKGITAYVKEHGLQNPDNKREILTNNGTPESDALKTLLRTEETVTFFNLQKYLKVHFPQSSPKSSEVDPEESKEVSTEAVTAPAPAPTKVVKRRVVRRTVSSK